MELKNYAFPPEADRKQLSAAGEIFLSKTLQVDSHSKKGDSTEPRTLVSPVGQGVSVSCV